VIAVGQRFAGDDFGVEERAVEDEELGSEREISCDFLDLKGEDLVELAEIVDVELKRGISMEF
jgi:hypothetical protein